MEQPTVPQTGPAMLRHALQTVLTEADKGRVQGLYGPLLAYAKRAINEADTPATQFVAKVAGLSLWDWSLDNGDQALECEAPDDGFMDSHACLMGLIEEARKLAAGASTPAPDSVSSAPVKYWNATHYNPDGETATTPFEMQIDDRRASAGQLYVTLHQPNADPVDVAGATVEINRLPGEATDVPCVHLHFDESNLAASFFKSGTRFILRPETGVAVRSETLATGEHVFVLEPRTE